MSALRDRLSAAIARTGEGSTDYDLNPDVRLPPGRVLRPAAVLLAVTEEGRVVLTKRSSRLKHHPGQIALPGGKKEPGDATLADAALRESEEEVGLPRGQVEILGALPPHETVTSFDVTPFIGLIHGSFEPRAEVGEVAEIFEVPLYFVTDPARFRIEGRRWQGRMRHYYAVPYGPYYIWGATARILRGLAGRMA
ncbi:CoA pyrophosphatase [Roseisalinus antarcticus]|uniref:Putative NUDIX hydrolase n=1 Tax=Roseisalinus antarcticus TaxID=254357 RepID=A0A1Y5S5B5_9RHOB|nr:CoA pyrophosphatase [Roseisalinus antarcticus]SLN32685.1 putative NUDIX hydrolase [Roseisalinus antarcticus]